MLKVLKKMIMKKEEFKIFNRYCINFSSKHFNIIYNRLLKNKSIFNDKLIPWKTSINLVIANVALLGNNSKASGPYSIE